MTNNTELTTSTRRLVKHNPSGEIYVTDGKYISNALHHTDWSEDGGYSVKDNLDLDAFNLDEEILEDGEGSLEDLNR